MTAQYALVPLPTSVADTAITDAVAATFTDLDAAQLLGPIERAKRAALIKAAQTLDQGMAEGVRLSVATSNVMKQVMDGLDSLPRPIIEQDGGLDALAITMTRLTDQAFTDAAQTGDPTL